MTRSVVRAPDGVAIARARERLGDAVVRTPLVPLDTDGRTLWLKLENLQPIGSFKLRGAGNAMLTRPPDALTRGVVTASAGNMAQGVAWWALRLGVVSTAVVPDRAPRAKIDAIERLGGSVRPVPFDDWWALLAGDAESTVDGVFIHPVADSDVIAGNATLGLEILEQLPEVETVLVPFGGGGLSTGIAAALRAAGSSARVLGCEVETATPLTAALAAGGPVTVPHTPSFVEGIGGRGVLPVMWPLVSELLAGAAVVSLDQVAAAIREITQRHHVVAEGAGAASVAAGLAGHAVGPTVCVVSGGNIDLPVLGRILGGETPR